MRILLQNFETGLYFVGNGRWTQILERALAFRDQNQANEVLRAQQLANTSVVVRPEPSDRLEPLTIVEAQSDVGMGNALFIRGEGEGLSWNKGQPLSRFDASKWIWSSHQSGKKVVFKLLLNDRIWARGQDVEVRAGRRVELAPVFS
jgi:hypothetical protein